MLHRKCVPDLTQLDNTNVVHGEGDRRCYSSSNEGDGLVSEKGDSQETHCAWLRRVCEPPNGQKQVFTLVFERRRHVNRVRWQLLLYTPCTTDKGSEIVTKADRKYFNNYYTPNNKENSPPNVML